MRFPRWAVPMVLRLLSLTGLTSAAGGERGAQALAIGFALSTNTNPTSQPLSLDFDFFLQVADLEVKVPIMPLHLLGKKSWNVYNNSNIEVVRRDEAIAKAAEEAEEQRLEELDAERRIQILRGEIPPPLAIEDTPKEEKRSREREQGHDGERREKKRRKKNGEDDTDFEMRIAHLQSVDSNKERQIVLRKDTNAPITDHSGHISLFPAPSSTKHVEKNLEAEKELARKKREYEDQYTMRFDNAAGFKKSLGESSWYSKSTPLGKGLEEDEVLGKDVWGNEDPRRRDREAKRIVESDPLAFMKQGAAKVREVERERKKWREEKEREIREMEEADERRKRRRHDDDSDDLESFRLDNDDKPARGERHRDRDEEDRERRHRRKHARRSEHSHRERDEERRHRHKHRRRSD